MAGQGSFWLVTSPAACLSNLRASTESVAPEQSTSPWARGGGSNEPISHIALPLASPSCGRVMPRWSVAGGGQSGLPASMAGLPAIRASVWVDPPLSASGPSFGSVLFTSPALAKPQLASLLRLYPWEVMPSPAQLPFEPLSATIVFLTAV